MFILAHFTIFVYSQFPSSI